LPEAGELGCSGEVSRVYSTCDTRRVTLLKHPAISHEWRKDWVVITRNGTYPCSFGSNKKYLELRMNFFPVSLTGKKFIRNSRYFLLFNWKKVHS
jgi:hypothetical protein